MQRALQLADWAGFAARREAASARGRRAGIGVANYVEAPVGAPHERVSVAVLAEGVVEIVVGTQSSGQVHGGIVQGLGQALCEGVVYDPGNAQVLSASFLDYALLRARILPGFGTELVEDPTEGNPLRIKGAGESGITPALAVLVNAVVDALRPLGIMDLEMPLTASRVRTAIANARSAPHHSPPG